MLTRRSAPLPVPRWAVFSLAVLGLFSLGAPCGGPKPRIDVELVSNGGFESGSFDGWSVTGSCEVHDATSPWSAPAVGSFFLYGGDDVDASTCRVSQDISLSAANFGVGLLDQKTLLVDASAWLRDYSPPGSFDDQVFLRVRYLDFFGEEISSLRTLIGNDDDWLQRFSGGLLPPGTRTLRVEVEASFRAGQDNDGMADEVSTMIHNATAAVPSVTKEPMLQDFRQDAMTILWETDGNLEKPSVEWGLAGGPLSNRVTKVETTEVDGLRFVHKATIAGLAAETEYDYRVCMGDQSFTTYRFRTAPLATSPYRIVWTSDNQNGPTTFSNVVGSMAAANPDLYISPGDIVQNGDVLSQWNDHWWQPLRTGDFAQTTPILFARGNHDAEHAYAYAYSALPENGSWYAFSYGNAFIVVLDTQAPVGSTSSEQNQHAWLQNVLASPEAQAAEFRIVTFHKPPYTNLWDEWNLSYCMGLGGGYIGESWIRANWVTLFELFGVDLVISGHTHSYQHGEQNGVHYVMVGGAGGALDSTCAGDWSFIDTELSLHHFSVMDVNDSVLNWNTYDENDVFLHGFTIAHP